MAASKPRDEFHVLRLVKKAGEKHPTEFYIDTLKLVGVTDLNMEYSAQQPTRVSISLYVDDIIMVEEVQ